MLHRHLLAVCASIRPSLLCHVVSDLVGLLANASLYLVDYLQQLSVCGSIGYGVNVKPSCDNFTSAVYLLRK